MAEQAVINRDDAQVMAMVADPAATNVTSFGSDQPIYVGDLGLQQQDGIEWLCTSDATSDDASNTGRRRKTDKQRSKGRLVQLMPSDALQVRGRHNALNALAALALVRALGVSWAPALHALRQYHGEADRTEFVRTVAGVDFINDSKGTNVGASVAALQGLEQKAVLIAGGVSKGQDFTPLAQAAGKYARAVVLIGQDAASLSAALQKASSQGLTVQHAKTLDEAVATAFRLAQSGDAVLLSPACASHDMFADYRARGRAFIDAAQEIALENGEIA